MAISLRINLVYNSWIHRNTSRRTHKGVTTKPQMKAKVVKDVKELTCSQTEANFSKGNSVLDIAMFCNVNDVKNSFTARMLSHEVLNLVK